MCRDRFDLDHKKRRGRSELWSFHLHWSFCVLSPPTSPRSRAGARPSRSIACPPALPTTWPLIWPATLSCASIISKIATAPPSLSASPPSLSSSSHRRKSSFLCLCTCGHAYQATVSSSFLSATHAWFRVCRHTFTRG